MNGNKSNKLLLDLIILSISKYSVITYKLYWNHIKHSMSFCW